MLPLSNFHSYLISQTLHFASNLLYLKNYKIDSEVAAPHAAVAPLASAPLCFPKKLTLVIELSQSFYNQLLTISIGITAKTIFISDCSPESVGSIIVEELLSAKSNLT